MTQSLFTVPEDGTSERLDRWLAQQMPEFSRARLQQLIAQGQVLRNGQGCKGKDPLRPGDEVQVEVPATLPLGLAAEAMDLQVIFEDAHLIVLNKPQGLVVHPSPGHSTHTLVNGLLAHCTDLSGINGVERPGIVHRLDKDTSGLLVVAKHDQAHRHLQAQIQAKTARREYWGVVHGSPRAEAGTVDAPLGRHPVHRQKMAVVPEGRPARTHWRVLERLGNFSLLHFGLETGRTHQIRVHSLQLGHPVVGDPLYSQGKTPVKLVGQALHAHYLSFVHPVSGESLAFQTAPPALFMKLLRVLGYRLTSPGND
ncbi:RluA family pseudouridine synthase [Candidatus Cyanaurora vandensis]|uniref:RluA family pseudouridine synthase n=1 Tax=Candidatus Cyanaurora vandensis TaxID=2714958 RepID=UPI00257BD035|nr:RluA family pseudouridine synthase [Candidatus Cyanaurora vandensis]